MQMMMSMWMKYVTEIKLNIIYFFAYFRHILASLHFNENLSREHLTGKDGSGYVQVTYPKFKLGDEVVRDISVPPTYRK